MELKRAIERARRDAAYHRREQRRFEADGMTYSAKLAAREAEMLEALVEAAERSRRHGD